MDFNLQQIAQLAIGGVPALVALIGFFRGPSSSRRALAQNVKLYESLPEKNGGRDVLDDWIHQQVVHLRNFEADAVRDVGGSVVSFILTLVLGGLAYWMVDLGTWWSYTLAGMFVLFCIAGIAEMFDRIQLARRDQDGKRIPD